MSDGRDGRDGLVGRDGPQGADGPEGPVGQPAKSVKGVKAFVAVQVAALFAMAGVVIWSEVKFDQQRQEDCEQTLDIRVASVESDIAVWQDVQDILGNDTEDMPLFDDLYQRIRDRADAAPLPATCEG